MPVSVWFAWLPKDAHDWEDRCFAEATVEFAGPEAYLDAVCAAGPEDWHSASVAVLGHTRDVAEAALNARIEFLRAEEPSS